MPVNLKAIEERITELVSEAQELQHFIEEHTVELFGSEGAIAHRNPVFYELKKRYQRWYGVCFQLLQNNMGFRLKEFENIYEKPQGGMWGGLCIKDLLTGEHTTILHAQMLQMGIQNQCAILESMPEVIRARTLQIDVLATAQLLDDELLQATYLLKRGFIRAAGAIGGVVLERHLKSLCRVADPPISIPSKKTTISDLNDQLRAHQVLSDADWRRVQWMADVRNLCDHERDQEPGKEVVLEFIQSLAKFIKTTLQ